jgi:hypothetical protein
VRTRRGELLGLELFWKSVVRLNIDHMFDQIILLGSR